MAKKRKAARKPAKRSATKRGSSKRSGDDTVNALVILVVIVLVLAGCYLYFQKAKADPVQLGMSPAAITLEHK